MNEENRKGRVLVDVTVTVPVMSEDQSLAIALIMVTSAARRLRARLARNGVNVGFRSDEQIARDLNCDEGAMAQADWAGLDMADSIRGPRIGGYIGPERQLMAKPDPSKN